MATTPVAGAGRRHRVIGWVAVALATLVASFFGMFAGGEAVMEGEGFGWGALLTHGVQVLIVVLIALAAVRWPRVGGSLLILVGLGIALLGIVPRLTGAVTPSEGDTMLSALIGAAPFILLPIAAGLLFFFGKPSPRRLVYIIVVAVPLAFTALAAVLAALIGAPPAE